MWNKREETPLPKPEPPRPVLSEPPAPPPVAREIPRNNNQPPVQGPCASIGASMLIVGDIFSREELLVDGEVEGKLESQHRITVGPNGKVRAGIKAREVVVAGSVQGNIDASDKITIRQGGSLVGDIKAARIVIDDGAYFKGSIDIVKAPPIVEKPAEPVATHA